MAVDLHVSATCRGENALEFDLATGDWAFRQIGKQIRSFSPGEFGGLGENPEVFCFCGQFSIKHCNSLPE